MATIDSLTVIVKPNNPRHGVTFSELYNIVNKLEEIDGFSQSIDRPMTVARIHSDGSDLLINLVRYAPTEGE